MNTRKLVDIGATNHKEIEAIRKFCQKRNGFSPTVPSLVQDALSIGLPYLKVKIEMAGSKSK